MHSEIWCMRNHKNIHQTYEGSSRAVCLGHGCIIKRILSRTTFLEELGWGSRNEFLIMMIHKKLRLLDKQKPDEERENENSNHMFLEQ